MSDSVQEPEPPYHLLLEPDEIRVTAAALRLLDADEAHEPEIHRLIREVLAGLDELPDARGILTVALAPQQMKITHTAVKLLLNDTAREQAAEREILWAILEKLPDEHTMRAIQIQ
jgi:hypothetical protein